MPNSLDRIFSGSPYGFSGPGQIQGEDIDPDSLRQMLVAIARGAVAEPIAGLAGLASLPWGLDQATSNMDSVRETIGYQPKETGLAKYIGQVMGPATDWASENIGDLRTKAGNATLEATGSPGLASMAHSAPELGSMLLTGGMMVPAVRSVSRAMPGGSEQPDMGRRRAVKTIGAGVGLIGAAAVAPKLGKTLMDTGVKAPAVGAKAAPAAVSAVAKSIPRGVGSVSTFNMTNLLRTYPSLHAAYKKGGPDALTSKLNMIGEERMHLDDEMLTMGKNSKEYRELIDREIDLRSEAPNVEIEDDYLGVDWDEVNRQMDNPDAKMDVEYGKDMTGDMRLDKYYEDYPDGMTPDDVHMTFSDLSDMDTDFEGIMSRKDYNVSLKNSLEDKHIHPKTKESVEKMLKNKDSYDDYLQSNIDMRNEYGIEYYF